MIFQDLIDHLSEQDGTLIFLHSDDNIKSISSKEMPTTGDEFMKYFFCGLVSWGWNKNTCTILASICTTKKSIMDFKIDKLWAWVDDNNVFICNDKLEVL